MRKSRMSIVTLATVLGLGLGMGSMRARADAALLMEEPYGTFGAINPTGHAAVYLNHICAESPTQLRPCHQEVPLRNKPADQATKAP